MTETHPLARSRWSDLRRQRLRRTFRPAPHLTVSEWAERFRQLSKEGSAEPGRWRNARTPYLVEIMDAISDPEVEEIAVMKAAQVGYTQGIIGNTIGYFIDQDPSDILVVQPADGDAEGFSKEKLAPMIRDTPRLAMRINDSARDTILFKRFSGGTLSITGATSPKGLRRRSARILLFDEVDGYPDSAGSEGDPVTLARKRADTFWNRKIILGSTPTIKGRSRIEKAFLASDQRYWHVPCPHCGVEQVLKWGGPDKPYGIKWENDDPSTTYYLCEANACVIEAHHQDSMIPCGRWVPSKPGAPVRGYHMPAFISLFDGAQWPRLVAQWLAAKNDPSELVVFVNTVLAETWEEKTEVTDPAVLEARREIYPAEVPAGVGVLTASVDVQGDRLEFLVKGWGVGEESWDIAHHRIHGDIEKGEVWQTLESLRVKGYRHESGQILRIERMFVDAGYRLDLVAGYVKGKELQGVYALHGDEGRKKELLRRPTRPNKYGIKAWTVAVDMFKDVLFRRLSSQRPGPGYMHFGPATTTGGDAEYFAQFGRERRKKNGGFEATGRNEAVDLNAYCIAALHTIPNIKEQLPAYVTRANEPPPEEKPIDTARPPRQRGSWATNW